MDYVIAAAPGYFILRLTEDGTAGREPIVAWRVEGGDRNATPIVLDTERGYEFTNPPILCPDGQVIQPYNRSWALEAAWLDSAVTDKKKNAGPV